MRLWPTTLARPFLSTRLGMEYCRDRVRHVLHALGVRLRRPRYRHRKANPPAQAAFLAKLPEIVAALPDDGPLRFVDAATVRRHPPLTVPWCLGTWSQKCPPAMSTPQSMGMARWRR
jgi:hypothetical protein